MRWAQWPAFTSSQVQEGGCAALFWSSETQKEALAGQVYLNKVGSVHLITNGAFVHPLPTAVKLF